MSSPEACPLSWKGVTLYGVFDYGAGYETHRVPFNGNYPNGVETLRSRVCPIAPAAAAALAAN